LTGWEGLPRVELDGDNWPLDVAATILDMTERDLRDLVRLSGLKPVGTMTMAQFRRSGRTPRVYDGSRLALLCDEMRQIREKMAQDT
jgi:hypothetical protein